jgi:glutathione reductase (NADPH)
MVETEQEEENTYDLVVIGTGNAGMAMALEARRAGWKIAITDELPYGGTCAVKGCIPKKVLFGAAEVIERAHALETRGISGDLHIVWPDLMRFKRTFTDPVPATKEVVLREKGIATYHGHARFLGEDTLQVGGKILKTRFTGIATGAIPRKLGIPGEEFVCASEDFLAAVSLPERIVFIGGGFISFEFAYLAAKAGSAVTILHRSGDVLKEFDPSLVGILLEVLRAAGIEIFTDMPVVSVEKNPGAFRVHAGKGGAQIYAADMVVHGAGRVPNLAELDLGRANVALDARGIAINPYLQSVSNPRVYVAGDVNARGKPLSPVATMEGRTAAKNMIHGNTIVPEYAAVPSVVFVAPLLASVGLREDQVAKRGIPAVVHKKETADWYSNRRVGITRGGYKILTEEKTGRILGAHLLGYHADEMINLFALAIQQGLTLTDLQETVWAYPTAGYDINRIK